MLCNVVVLGRTGVHAAERAVSVAGVDFGRAELHVGTALLHTVAKLHSYKDAPSPLSRARYALREAALGFAYSTHPLIVHERLRLDAASIALYQRARCVVADGVADVEIGVCTSVAHSDRPSAAYAECCGYGGQ